MPNSKDDSLKIRVIRLANSLKARMGDKYKNQEDGFIAPEAIAQADQIIADMCLDCQGEIGKNLDALNAQWTKIKDTPDGPERKDLIEKIFLLSHEIKDLGAICGYELISYFAESLRDYIGKTELSMQAQIIIIQAHLDAMGIVHKKGVKKNAGPEAEELKRIVRKAIDKYH